MKTCSKCRRSLPVDEFYKNRAKPDGLDHYCRDSGPTRREGTG